MPHNSASQPFRIGLDFNKPISKLDPSRINVLSEAILLRNLYGALFDYNLDGNIITGLADRFSWHEGSLHVHIPNRRLSDGSYLTVEDVEFSLRRLIFLDKNNHGSLKEILCPDFKPISIDSKCPNLTISGEHIIFKTFSEPMRKLLIPLLATVDFRIVPRAAFDLTTEGILIKNFSITTGPYFVKSADDSGNINLEANKFYHNYSNSMPSKVNIRSLTIPQILREFESGQLDAIGTSTPITSEDMESLQKSIPDISLAKTLNLKIRMIFFGKSIISETTPSERFYLSRKLMAFYERINLPFETPTIEFFQDLSSGYLNSKQKDIVYALRQSGEGRAVFKRKFNVAVGKSSLSKWGDFFKGNPDFHPFLVDRHPLEEDVDKRPDIFSGVNDVSFNRSLSVIAYNLNQGIFGIYGKDASDWLSNFIQIPDSESVSALNNLHFEALSKCALYPIASSPYILLTRNGWRANVNPFFSSTELWLIKRD